MSTKAQLRQIGERGPFRASDATAVGIPRTYLQRWVEQGLLQRVGRGLYRLADSEASELSSVAEVARRAPQATVCLLSALFLHELTTELPSAVWLMIEGRNRAPRIDFVRTEVVRASGEAFRAGIERRVIEGVPVRVTSPAKTVSDCFRYRRHVGLDVALEALRDYMKAAHERRSPQYTMKHLAEAMHASRVTSVMRPYAEALA